MSHSKSDLPEMTSQSTPDPLSPLSLSTRPVGEEKQHTDSPTSPASPSAPRLRTRTSTTASVASNASSRIRAASIKLLEADPPPGFMAGIGSHASKAPTLPDIRRGSYSKDGWSPIAGSGSEKGRREGVQGNRSAGVIGTSDSQDQAATAARPGLSARDRKKSGSPTSNSGIEPFPTLLEETNHSAASTRVGNSEVQTEQDAKEQARGGVHTDSHLDRDMSEKTTDRDSPVTASPKKDETSQPWTPPPKLPWTTSMAIGLRAFSKWVLTIPGFLITVYGLNVVAWGGMLFLLLCNAAPAMCRPSCDDINSPRRIWIEIDSQILNALFCVTGFGLAPWRFRDLYWWGCWRLGKGPERRSIGIRRLAGIHRGWFRLAGSDKLVTGSPDAQDPSNPALPIPVSKAPPEPLTTVRAVPTAPWRMDYVVWCNIMNTFLQTVLSGFMWGLNRYDRPSWSTGLFVGLAFIAAGMGGLMVFQEGKKVKKVEGVEVSVEERKARGWDVESVRGGATAVGAAASDGVVREQETRRKPAGGLKHKVGAIFG